MNRSGFLFGLMLVPAGFGWCDNAPQPDPVVSKVSFDQRLNAQVPLEAAFRNEQGQPVRLKDYFRGKPVILSLVYYECPMLCTETLNGLVRALRSVPFNAGREFDVLTVSFNPREGSALAAAKKEKVIERYGRPRAAEGWGFLTGDETSIRRLTDAVGFHFEYDPKSQQYAHATGVMILTPAGRVSHYFYGVEYLPRDLRLALVESASGRIGSPVDKLLLTCFQYDPLSGKYGLMIMRVLRSAGVLTVVLLVIGIAWALRRERRAAASAA